MLRAATLLDPPRYVGMWEAGMGESACARSRLCTMAMASCFSRVTGVWHTSQITSERRPLLAPSDTRARRSSSRAISSLSYKNTNKSQWNYRYQNLTMYVIDTKEIRNDHSLYRTFPNQTLPLLIHVLAECSIQIPQTSWLFCFNNKLIKRFKWNL